MAKEKALHRTLAQIWQEVKGSAGAVCPYPHFQKEPFEDLARLHDHDVIAEAFRLYAADAPGADREKYPIDKFMINANDWMLKARPAAEPSAAPVDPEAKRRQDESVRRLLAEDAADMRKTPAPVAEMDPEAFLKGE